MIHSIRPDYSHKHLCHFCKKREAEKKYEELVVLYQVIDKNTHLLVGRIESDIKYYQTNVMVPCCEYCKKNRGAGIKPSCIIGIILFLIIVSLVIYRNIKNESELDIFNIIIMLFGILMVGFVILIIASCIEWVISRIVSKRRGTSERTNNYPPIKLLLKIGFFSSKPQASGIYLSYKVKTKKLIDAIEEIEKRYHCEVELREELLNSIEYKIEKNI